MLKRFFANHVHRTLDYYLFNARDDKRSNQIIPKAHSEIQKMKYKFTEVLQVNVIEGKNVLNVRLFNSIVTIDKRFGRDLQMEDKHNG